MAEIENNPCESEYDFGFQTIFILSFYVPLMIALMCRRYYRFFQIRDGFFFSMIFVSVHNNFIFKPADGFHPSKFIVVAFMYGVVIIKCANWAKCCGVPDRFSAVFLSSLIFPWAIATIRIPARANSTAHAWVIASILAFAVSLAIWPNTGWVVVAETALIMTPFSPSASGSFFAIKPTPSRTVLNVPAVFACKEMKMWCMRCDLLQNLSTYYEYLLEIFQFMWFFGLEIVCRAGERWRHRVTIDNNIQFAEFLLCLLQQRGHITFRTDISGNVKCIFADGTGNGRPIRRTHIAENNTSTFASKVFGSGFAEARRGTSH